MSQNVKKCPLCAHAVHIITTSAPGYQRGTDYWIYECENCLSSFAAPLESNDLLYSLIYTNIQSVPGYNRYFRYAHEVLNQQNPLEYLSRQEESYWAVAQHVVARKTADEELKILEVGCGMGYFSYALHQAGLNVTGVDLSATAVAWACDHYGPFYECISLHALHESGEKYDVIVMNQLIEHIPDVHKFIAEALALLSPKGELLLTTPNKSAYPDAQWETELPPVHLWWFGEKSMNCIARQHECVIDFVDFTSFYDSFAILKSSGTQLRERHSVFDEQGKLLINQDIPLLNFWRNKLKQIGLLKMFRKTKNMLLQRKMWQGACGPICACILRPLQVMHD